MRKSYGKVGDFICIPKSLYLYVLQKGSFCFEILPQFRHTAIINYTVFALFLCNSTQNDVGDLEHREEAWDENKVSTCISLLLGTRGRRGIQTWPPMPPLPTPCLCSKIRWTRGSWLGGVVFGARPSRVGGRGGRCSEHHMMFSSIAGLCPLDASSKHCLPHLHDNPKCLLTDHHYAPHPPPMPRVVGTTELVQGEATGCASPGDRFACASEDRCCRCSQELPLRPLWALLPVGGGVLYRL